MPEPVSSLPFDEFLAGLTLGVFTDDEIVQWLLVNRPKKTQQTQIVSAISQLKGGSLSGAIRTAIRALHDLPPVAGE